MKYWFITGISNGLGKALSQSVMENNDFVIGTFRKQSQVDHFNEMYQGKGFAYLLDITNFNEIENVVHAIISQFGKIDVLVNNAGVGFVGAIEEASINEIKSVFEINLFGTLKLTQAVLPFMRKQKNGNIVQISSHGGIKAFAGFGIYNASKFALEGFSEALAEEVKSLGIKVLIVEPGPFRTSFAGNGLIEAQHKIDDYSNTSGVFRTKLKNIDGKQEGDPVKAAKAIIKSVNSENSILRLPLGKIAIKTIGMKLENVKTAIEFYKEIAEDSVYS